MSGSISTPRWPGAPIEVGQRVLVTDLCCAEERDRIIGRIGVVKRATPIYQEVEIEGKVYLLDSDNREIVPAWGQSPERGAVPDGYLRYKALETCRDEESETTRPTYGALMAQECLRARGLA